MDKLTVAKSQWDRLTAVVTAIAGGVVLLVGWLGVSDTAYPAEQLPYIISDGLGGLFLLGVSSVLWLSADLHDEWRKLDRIEQAIRAAGMAATSAEGLGAADHPARRGAAADSPDGARTRRSPQAVVEGES